MKTKIKFLCCVLIASQPASRAFSDEKLPDGAEEKLSRAFEQQDTNGDGKIGPEELMKSIISRQKNPVDEKLARRIGQSVMWEFARIDLDRDGSITLGEIKADLIATLKHKKSLDGEDRKLFEGRFSQCSFNALASVLIHFQSPTPELKDRGAVESAAFHEPLKSAKFGGYYGWGPWTSYMVNSGDIEWNGKVANLKAENFSIRPEKLPETDAKARTVTVRYAPGEREMLEKKMLEQLKRGPVVMWTPYASVMSPVPKRWKHVTHKDDETDIVPFGPFTHAVTWFLKDDGRLMVVDGSTPDGVFYSDIRTAVATSSAMTAFIRISPGEGKKSIFDRSRGIENDEYNVVVFRSEEDE